MDSRTQYPFQPVRQNRVSVEILTEDGARFFGMHQPHLDSFSDKAGDDTQKRNLSGPGFYMQVLDIGSRYPEIPFHFPDFFQDLFGQGSRTRRTSKSTQHSGEMNATVNIDLYTALLGGEVIIQLGNGDKVKLKVKPETQNNTKVRLRGKGYSRGDGSFGDLIITYNVVLPQNLSEHQKDLIKQMRDNRI